MKDKNKIIVVMGGSFNPPTLAHYILMREAIDSLDADKGIFVPVSDAYLRRKLRHAHPPVVLSPEMRVRMLKSICTDSRMSVSENEIGTVEPRTMPTLKELHEEYPDAELYFLMGADKLELLSHLADKKNFLKMSKVVLFSRDKTGLEETLRGDEVLSQYLHRIVTLPQPEGTDSVSSSRVRELMLAGESCEEMLCPNVWDLFKRFRPEDFPDIIDRFNGEYDYLSNRFGCQFIWQELTYSSAEAAFQSSKCTDMTEREAFCKYSPDKAAMKGGNIVPPSGWENERLGIMESVLTAKFEQNPCLMKKLTETENTLLINGNNKKDTFWGIDLYSWQGENHLGKILMRIRDKEKSK